MSTRSARRRSWRRKFPPVFQRWFQLLARLGPGLRRQVVFLLLLITVLMGPNGLLTNLPVIHAQAASVGKSGPPNRGDPRQNATSVLHRPAAGKSDPNWKPHAPRLLGHAAPPPMQPGTLTLQAGTSTQFLGSDGRLEVDVPPGAVTASDESQAGGKLSLLITQIAPESGSSAGGSGQISLGTYLVQLVDTHGKRVPHGLRAPLTIKYHYGSGERALDLAHVVVVQNSPLPQGVTLAPAAGANTPDLGPRTTQPATLDATQQTLTVTPQVSTPSSSLSWNTDSPVASFGKPDLFNGDLSAGSLSASYGIDVPAGPGGLTPPISLAYSSAGVSENHSVQGAAGWVGEGWTLAPGSISWAEHNVVAGVSGTPTWQNSWQFSDPYGTSAELIPPTITTSISLDDTGNSTSNPVSWQTTPDAHIRVISYTGPNSVWAAPANPPCFRVFLQNGLMEEFGCTPDSLQYYYGLSGNNKGYAYVSSWLLDMVVDSAGNQIHYTYQADSELDSVGGHDVRDVVLSTIEWDSPTCQNTQTRCTSTTGWAPLMQVSFSAAHNPLRLTALLPGTCNTGTNLRCDDPLDLSSSGGMAAPQVESTFVLNDIQVQVNTSGTWNTLKDYQLSYEQGGPSTISDPLSGQQESTAGTLDLTGISVVGDDGTTLEPVRSFGYTTQTEHYEDDAYKLSSNCGPSWNSGCLLWSQSYSGNSRYLTSASNGMGLYQTWSWAEARNNTHGVNGGGSNALNPLYCDGKESQGYPCSQADDQAWSHMVLTSEQASVVRLSQNGQGGQQTSTPVTSTTAYTYQLAGFAAQPCSDCAQGMYWGNQNDADYLDYYNGKFQGFAQASVSNPDGSLVVHKFFSTEGWGVYNTSKVTCYSSNPCHTAPWWHAGTGLHGHEYETDQYDTNGTTLLQQTKTQYSFQCPAVGVSGSGSTSYGDFDGNLVSELDHGNPVASCDIQTSQVDDYTYDGSNASGVPHTTTTYQYDPQGYGRVTQQKVTTNDGGATGSPTTMVTTTSYIWNDSVTSSSTSAGGTYLINFPAFTDTEDTSGNRYSCISTSYFTAPNTMLPFETGPQSAFTLPLVSSELQYANCGTKANNFSDVSGPIKTSSSYDGFGNPVTTTDADGHTDCTPSGGSGSYTTCINYDPIFHTLPVSSANALNQSTSTGYTQSAAGGFGLWPTSTTDANGQATTTTYDGLGRATSSRLPGETSGLTTSSQTYTDFCAATGPQSPCLEIDQTQRLNSTTTTISRTFYDGYGRPVETRTPGSNGQDVVTYRYYDTSGRAVFESLRYFVTAYTGPAGQQAYSIPDSKQNGTTTTYNNLLSTTVTDALSISDTWTTTESVVCNQATPSGGTDSACYVQTTSIDPLGHKQSTLTDALGREVYDQRYTGNSTATYALYATTQYTYDYTGNLVQILHPGGTITTTFQYDMAGRQIGVTDPDLGTESYVYDANGNVTQTTDARGSAGIIFAGYDGLNRQLWRNSTNSPTGAYVTYSYDSTANGNQGVGRLTGETFTGGPNQSLSGSYSNVYDARGQLIQNTLTVGGTGYQTSATYDDEGGLLSLTYPNGDVLTPSYTSQGWLASLGLQQGSTTTTLLSNLSYTGPGGPAGLASSASWNGGTYTAATTFDLLLRMTDTKVTQTSNQATLFEETPSYDAAGRVSSVTTTLPQGTDQQQFCYDEQDRLTWAGSVGTPSCTGTAITPGSLTTAQYTQSFAYDTLGRLISGPLGAYTYGDSHHVHAATTIGSAYTATYDASGNMTCRAPTSATTCTGSTPTGAQLSYNNEGKLVAWQNAPSAPSSTAAYLYDGEGNRIEQQVTQGGVTTTTTYVGRLEEVSTTGATTTTKTYYAVGGAPVAMAVNGVLSYLVINRLGSVTEVLDTSGNVQASQLYAPYGGLRYSSGTLPTTYGFTGQRQDAATGLNYYGARYYDPLAAQFISADLTLPGGGGDPWGLSRYAYVEGNPISFTDPTGNRRQDSCAPVCEPPGGPAPSGPEIQAPCDCMWVPGNPLEAESWDEVKGPIWWNDGEGGEEWKYEDGTGGGRTANGTTYTLNEEGVITSINGVPVNDQPMSGKPEAYNPGTMDPSMSGGHGGRKPPPKKTTPSPDDDQPKKPKSPKNPIPPTPNNMGQKEFGKKVIKWGEHKPQQGINGSDVARNRIETITLQDLQDGGVTKEIALEWYRFYEAEMAGNPNNLSAPGRADLMWYIYMMFLLSEPFSFP